MTDRTLFFTASLCLLTMCAGTSFAEGSGSSTRGSASKAAADADPVAALLAKMTLAEKIGQMTQPDLDSIKNLSEIRELALGSVLSGGNADPKAGNSAQAWTDLYNQCQGEALKTRLGIPILYGIDAVHGHSNVLDTVIFPHNIGLGCTDDADLIERISRVTALEIRATGIQWNFAPCVTVPRDDRWGRTYEGFSEDPERVAKLGAASVRGLQTDDLSNPEAVLACAKHFVGDGGTVPEMRRSPFHADEGIYFDQGDARCDAETMRRVHIAPYLPCLEEGVASIMPSYSSWNGIKCTGNKELLTDLLKGELGFDGFLISDYNAIDQVNPDYKTAIGICINAGIDMAMISERHHEYVKNLTELVNEGVVPMERIDDAVTRILRVKHKMGLLDKDRSQMADPALMEDFGSPERRELGREAVRKSLVLLKNEGALPLNGTQGTIHVTGTGADDVGMLCGGWTIDWQGGMGEITSGTTILEGLREVGDATFTHSKDGSGAEDAEAVIVVVGEGPYAEGMGDNTELTLSDADRSLVLKCAEADAPLVLVVVSGRPIILDDEVRAAANAIVAAWLPGTEGAGVADVLLGKHAPTGNLSFSWPKSADQHPINIGDDDYDPLFPVGYGLSYETGGE